MELLTTVYHKIHGTLKPHKILEHMRIGEYAAEVEGRPLGVRTGQVRDAFFETVGFPRLLDENVIRRAIAEGVKSGYFGYVGRADRIETDRVREGAGYLLPRAQAAFERNLPEDEIDLDAGFIVLPAAIEPEASQAVPTGEGPLPTPEGLEFPASMTPAAPSPGGPATSFQARVELHMRLTRAQLFESFKPLANLADKAGSIGLKVTAESLAGFDPVWLRNAVTEPLDEAGVELEG